MSNYIQEMKAKAAAQKKTIVLPESNDKRTYTAVEQIMKEHLLYPLLIQLSLIMGIYLYCLNLS